MKLIETKECIDANRGWYRKRFCCPKCKTLIRTELWDEKRCFGTGSILYSGEAPKFCPECGTRIE